MRDQNTAFDSEAWRRLRDEKLMEWICDEFAVQFIVTFSDVCEVFDDLWDGDKPVTRDDLSRTLFNCLAEIPINPFFDRFKQQLVPIIITGINAWLDANALENGNRNDRVFAYVLRDWYMELIAFVIYLTRGRDHMRRVSLDVREFFTHHETLEEYMGDLA
ncbi:hypothetical protein DSD19_04535 [Rhodovulum sp. BSW8]|uniref:hypothetical protein n=1 Tax=Rhodovulum sp. BSW8 TaxID=2259645 RepID=UPI000DE26B22|nr:hypothetical protein [Rhodovulum sp. BSW8]RBO54778.1 hypothetical protein DSD19_04535 [Rhodovulum sp. BSW8]